MLYLLGGAPRSGKSILARRINRETGLQTISTDLMRGVLMQVDSELREAMAAHDPIREGTAFFSHLAQTLLVAEIQVDDCLVEGVGFLPRHVPRLERIVKSELRACFVGRSSATPEEIFGHETEHRIYDGWSNEQRRSSADGVVRWTELIQRDCIEHDVPFFDLARDFDAGLSQAQAMLLDSQ